MTQLWSLDNIVQKQFFHAVSWETAPVISILHTYDKGGDIAIMLWSFPSSLITILYGNDNLLDLKIWWMMLTQFNQSNPINFLKKVFQIFLEAGWKLLTSLIILKNIFYFLFHTITWGKTVIINNGFRNVMMEQSNWLSR